MQPRYEPTYNLNHKERFLGRAGELDVWTELNSDYGDKEERWIILVGPEERKLRADTDHNFDVYPVENNVLSHRDVAEDGKDIHVELPEMCQVYQLCAKHGYITTE